MEGQPVAAWMKPDVPEEQVFRTPDDVTHSALRLDFSRRIREGRENS